MASLFRFPGVTIEADVTQTVAVRAADGKFYRVLIQDIVDLATGGGGGLEEPLTLTEPLTSNYVLAEVIGAAIVNPGTGGTPGAATVTTTTGTGTPAQVEVTIGAGGDIEVVDSVLVAGVFTVPPTDPTAEPVTGGGLTGAMLNLRLSFAPSIVGGDPTSGFGFDFDGLPILKGVGTVRLSFSFDGSSTSVGDSAGLNNTGGNLTAAGAFAGQNNTGDSLTAVGYEAGSGNTGSAVIIIGDGAGTDNTGSEVVSLGNEAAYHNIGDNVIAIGYVAATDNVGNHVTAVGSGTAVENTGNNLVAVGNGAASENTGDGVVAVGTAAAYGNTGDNVIAIGTNAADSNSTSNIINIGNVLTVTGTDVPSTSVVALPGTLTVGGAVILDLPTIDPEVVGQLWVDTGVFKLSTGP